MARQMTKVGFAALAALGGLVALLSASPAKAAQIFVQNSGTAAAGGDPNLITAPSTGFVIGVDGSKTLQTPLLVIVGVYDGTASTTAPTITFAGGVSTPALDTYGLTATQALFTSGDVFAALGLSSGGSESFGNWACGKNGCPGTGGDLGLGLAAPTSFELFAFALNTSLVGGTSISLKESGAPLGSYIVGYDCLAGTNTGTNNACDKSGSIAQSVYTNTGLIDTTGGSGGGGTVPEPGTLALFGTALLGLGFLCRRKKAA